MLQLIYELRKNCCEWVDGRVDGTGEIEGSTRGSRGPKKSTLYNCPPLIFLVKGCSQKINNVELINEIFSLKMGKRKVEMAKGPFWLKLAQLNGFH